MTDTIYSSTSYTLSLNNDQQWQDLYYWLLPLVKKWVWYANLPSWYGQQQEIAEDIVQEAIVRTYNYSQRATRGETRPVLSFQALSRIIARNYFRDRWRKDRHLFHMDQPVVQMETLIDPAQIALERLARQSALITMVQAIAKFPPRQKQALLRDLANISPCESSPTQLEQALAEYGIDLRHYRDLSSVSPVERSRNAALLHVAYKRLKKEMLEYSSYA